MLNLMNSIVNNTEGLKKEVAEIIVDMLSENADNEEVMGTVEDITTYGCASGCVPALIYCYQTEAFFNRHTDEIFELITDAKEEGALDLNNIELTRNELAWIAFELIAWEIRDELEAAMEFVTDSEGNEY